MQTSRVSIVAAMGKNREIGRGGELLWHIPDDLKRFKQLTLGHPVIMGRKTFESIVASLGKPLPGRTSIVVTRNPAYSGPSYVGQAQQEQKTVLCANSLYDAVAKAKELDREEIFIGGGSQIYEQALPFADKLYVTLVDDDTDGDAFFPAYERLFTKKVFEEQREWNGLKYAWVDLERADTAV